MTKLKTLKDLEGFAPALIHGQAFLQTDEDQKWTGNAILRDDLKAEAIKWVKDFHSGHYVRADGIKCTEDFIRHFFNITSEDLK